MIDSVFLNGTVGVGKSSTADALAALEEAAGHPHAVIDLDHIRRAWPAPPGDRFHHELELRNVLALVANFRSAGVEHFILAGVIEAPSEVPRYLEALASEGLILVRLEAPPAVVEQRLRKRQDPGSPELQWYLARRGELDAIIRSAGFDDLIVDTAGRTPAEVAGVVARAAGWT